MPVGIWVWVKFLLNNKYIMRYGLPEWPRINYNYLSYINHYINIKVHPGLSCDLLEGRWFIMAKPCPLLGVAIYLDCLDCDDKQCQKRQYKYNKVVIGVDQSYSNTGICIIADKKKKKLKSLQLHKEKNNSDKRRVLREQLDNLLKAVCGTGKEVVCIIERIRLHSQGFLNIDYIKSIGALNSIIIDKCNEYGVEVFSVDTRCWKAQVVGTSKGTPNKYGVPEEKWPTVNWCIKQGWEADILDKVEGRKTKGTFIKNDTKYMYNNDAADSAGIAMFGFVGDQDKLKLEV